MGVKSPETKDVIERSATPVTIIYQPNLNEAGALLWALTKLRDLEQHKVVTVPPEHRETAWHAIRGAVVGVHQGIQNAEREMGRRLGTVPPNSLARNVNTVYASPVHRLVDASIRLRHHRKWGPGHEIDHALHDVDVALDEMGFTFDAGTRDEKLGRVDAIVAAATTARPRS